MSVNSPQENAKRSYNEMKTGIPVNGIAVNGTRQALPHQVQQQQPHRPSPLAQQQRQAQLNGNTHGLAGMRSPSQRRVYNFAETTEELLKKYENCDPSLEFHIHENHYRFGNQVSLINFHTKWIDRIHLLT